MVQEWRPLAFWASCSIEHDGLIARVRAANEGCVVNKEVIQASTFKSKGTLTVDDYHEFNNWLLENERVSNKDVGDKLDALRLRRWATWHVLAPANPNIKQTNSVPLSLPLCFPSLAPELTWLCIHSLVFCLVSMDFWWGCSLRLLGANQVTTFFVSAQGWTPTSRTSSR